MGIELLDRLKRLAITAMFSDDDLMEMLVLKGGNLLDAIYNIASRASADVDFSLAGEFKKEELGIMEAKIRRALTGTFQTEGFTVFDINFMERPKRAPPGMPEFWGGYRVEFKAIETKRYEELQDDLQSLRRQAAVLGKNQGKKFSIDISKFEYCVSKREVELDEGFTIYVYTPEMIVFEKIRAICQQMEEYGLVVQNHGRSARARDFFDIYTILQHFEVDFTAQENMQLINCIFDAKRVPLQLISLIPNYREFHRPDFASVKDTVKTDVDLKDFDFYYDYIVDKCISLKSLWEI
ncbi:MAG: nucleotidyl transferase AbiEii/AbiGii toxin family protein [Syntrophobacteraceae bacterium]